MHARTFQLGLGLLLGCGSVACDNGVVTLMLLPAAAGTPDAAGQGGKSGGGAAGASGAAGDSRGELGGAPRQPPNLCDGPWEVEQEDAMFQTLSEAFDSGRYCPHLPPARQRPLAVDLDLQWQARAANCFPMSGENRGWFRLATRAPVFVWLLGGTPSLEDAKKALLNTERESLCREAEQNPFRRVGVAHSFESWSIVLAPVAPEDMQKP